MAAKIPFDNVFTEAIVGGMPAVEYSDGQVSDELRKLWQRITEILV